jgi:putative salt-induced outer membrane protein
MTTPTLAVILTLAIQLGSTGPASPSEPEEPVVPQGTVEAAPASTGATEVEGQGKLATADAEGRTATDATELDLAAGGLLSTGNAFAAAVTGQGRFRLRRGIHQGTAQAAGNFGLGTAEQRTIRHVLVEDALQGDYVRDEESIARERDTTVSNLQGMVRYDVYFAERWSAFVMATARRDRFQGLDLRFNLDPGVAFHVLSDAHHRLWLEAGYDFQYDRRREEAVFETRLLDPLVDADGDGLADTERVRIADDTLVNHAARLFFGYNNSLSDRVTLDTGLEYLQSVIVGRRYRVNWVNAVAIQLAGRLGVAVTFTLRYENEPLPGVKQLDTITAVLLTLRFV